MALTITQQPSANSFNASNNHLIYKVQSTVLETVHGELFIDDVNTNVKIKSKESFTAGIATHTFDFSSVADNFITDNQLPSLILLTFQILTNAVKKVKVRFHEGTDVFEIGILDSNDCFLINGTIQYEETQDLADFLLQTQSKKFLSKSPSTVDIGNNESLALRGIYDNVPTDSKNRCFIFYDKQGLVLGTLKSSVIVGGVGVIIDFAVGTKNLTL